MFGTRTLHPQILGAALAAALATPALACPPTLSIEVPTGGAREVTAPYVLVHAGRGCQTGTLAVTGTAEGLVGGVRRSIRLEVAPTATEGVYAVRRQWPRDGVWVLDLRVTVGAGHTTALVGIGPSGQVTAIRGPAADGRAVRNLSSGDVEAMLRDLAAG